MKHALLATFAFFSICSFANASTNQDFYNQREVLVAQLATAERAFTDSDYSPDPNSEYQQNSNNINALLKQLRELAIRSLSDK